MAFTKIAAAGIGSTGTVTLENLVVTQSINTPSITGAASTANIKSDSLIVSGVVTATSFDGDGSALTGIAVTENVRTNSLVVSGVSTLGNTIVGRGTTELIVNGDARITGILTVGTASITFNGNDNSITVGTAATISASGFVGSGDSLTSLNASNLGSGTIPDARFPATLPAVSGASLTSLNASNLGSGTIPDARFPATLPAVSGASLTSLNASNLGSGTIPDARFPATLPAVSGANLTNIPGGFVAGTLMLFQQTAAPTGWTKQTTHNNKALRVVSGNASSGGTTAFTTVFASRTPAGTVGSTTLTESQMPSHTHGAKWTMRTDGSAVPYTSVLRFDNGNSTTTTATGGGGSHNHGFTGTAMDFAVQYVDLIIASKD